MPGRTRRAGQVCPMPIAPSFAAKCASRRTIAERMAGGISQLRVKCTAELLTSIADADKIRSARGRSRSWKAYSSSTTTAFSPILVNQPATIRMPTSSNAPAALSAATGMATTSASSAPTYPFYPQSLYSTPKLQTPLQKNCERTKICIYPSSHTSSSVER